MPEQPDKCFEHHMLLKRELEDFKKEFDALTKNCKDMHCAPVYTHEPAFHRLQSIFLPVLSRPVSDPVEMHGDALPRVLYNHSRFFSHPETQLPVDNTDSHW